MQQLIEFGEKCIFFKVIWTLSKWKRETVWPQGSSTGSPMPLSSPSRKIALLCKQLWMRVWVWTPRSIYVSSCCDLANKYLKRDVNNNKGGIDKLWHSLIQRTHVGTVGRVFVPVFVQQTEKTILTSRYQRVDCRWTIACRASRREQWKWRWQRRRCGQQRWRWRRQTAHCYSLACLLQTEAGLSNFDQSEHDS